MLTEVLGECGFLTRLRDAGILLVSQRVTDCGSCRLCRAPKGTEKHVFELHKNGRVLNVYICGTSSNEEGLKACLAFILAGPTNADDVSQDGGPARPSKAIFAASQTRAMLNLMARDEWRDLLAVTSFTSSTFCDASSALTDELRTH